MISNEPQDDDLDLTESKASVLISALDPEGHSDVSTGQVKCLRSWLLTLSEQNVKSSQIVSDRVQQ